MFIMERPAMASPILLHSLLLPSSLQIPLFLRMFSLSGIISILGRMHVPGIIRLARVCGAMYLAGLPGLVGLTD